MSHNIHSRSVFPASTSSGLSDMTSAATAWESAHASPSADSVAASASHRAGALRTHSSAMCSLIHFPCTRGAASVGAADRTTRGPRFAAALPPAVHVPSLPALTAAARRAAVAAAVVLPAASARGGGVIFLALPHAFASAAATRRAGIVLGASGDAAASRRNSRVTRPVADSEIESRCNTSLQE